MLGLRYSYLSAFIFISLLASGQVDTSFIYKPNASYGKLDLRISRSESNYYYLDENKTFSYRALNGAKTNTYLDLTAWDSEKYQEGNLRQVLNEKDLFTMNYRLLVPPGYTSSHPGGYPLVLFLHGLHERGNCAESKCFHANRNYDPNTNTPPAPADPGSLLYNNDYNLIHGGLNYLEAGNLAGSKNPGDPQLDPRAYPGFVVFPQSNNEWDPLQVEDAIRIVRLLIKRYNINPDQIYLHGLSKGGYAGFEALKRAPWLFSSAVFFSPINDARIQSDNQLAAISHVPMWIFQGSKDTMPLESTTTGNVNAYRSNGLDVRYTIYPHLGHGTWNEALNEPDFFTWLLSKNKKNIIVEGNRTGLCPTNTRGLRLSLPPGYPAYEWEFNGKIIAGNGHTYQAKETGVYRARYAYYDPSNVLTWNTWSEEVTLTRSEALIPEVIQKGTLHLPDLNGNNTAVLQASEGYTTYNWVRGTQSVRLIQANEKPSEFSIPAATGNGIYMVTVAGIDQCASSPSTGKVIFFSNSSPLNIITPSELSSQNVEASRIKLSWKDNSSDEKGFEIWRRQTNNSEQTAWEMATLTSSNTTTYQDDKLIPETKYEYKVRAVSTNSRSEYASLTEGITTLPDQENPAPPQEVKASLSDVNTITLQWNHAVDNSGIDHYTITYNDSIISVTGTDSLVRISNLLVNEDYQFSIIAFDFAGNESVPSTIDMNTTLKGLFYKHSTGAWDNLGAIDWTTPEYTGQSDGFDLSLRKQEDFFNFRFDGYFRIKKEGVYQFRISSNDGSSLYLNDSLLVENDGIHALTTVTGPIQILAKGPQKIRVDFFDYMDSDTLVVEYKGPDTNREWVKMTEDVLTSSQNVQGPNTDELSVIVFPNPTTGKNINASIRTNGTEPIALSIFNSTGNLVHSVTLDANETDYSWSPENQVSGGVYILTIQQGNSKVSQRVIILP